MASISERFYNFGPIFMAFSFLVLCVISDKVPPDRGLVALPRLCSYRALT